MLTALAFRLPLLRWPLGVAAATVGAGGVAFETAAWLVGYRWLIPAGVGGLGLGWAIWHLIQSHDALHGLVQHAEVDASAIAGKGRALIERIRAHKGWTVHGHDAKEALRLAIRAGPGVPVIPTPGAMLLSTGPVTMTPTPPPVTS